METKFQLEITKTLVKFEFKRCFIQYFLVKEALLSRKESFRKLAHQIPNC